MQPLCAAACISICTHTHTHIRPIPSAGSSDYPFLATFLQNADYTTGQIFDLADKLEQSETQLGRGGFMLGMETQDKKTEDKLAKATKDG